MTTYYYLGGRLVAMRQNTTLTYIHQDHLTGTSVVSDSSGNLVSSIKYFPFGECRNSPPPCPTDKLFTGQRLDRTGLYYYGARYYDAGIGRFMSADIIVQDPTNPQCLNRYSYCLNNPLKYTDPMGMYFSVDYPWWYDEYRYVFCVNWTDPVEAAYQDIMNNPDIPQCIKDYMQILHDSDRVIYITFGNFGGEAYGLSAMEICVRYQGFFPIPILTTKDVISIDIGWLSNLAPILAHECYHIYEANPGSTVGEEYVAHLAQYFVERGLTGSSGLGWIFKGDGYDEFWKHLTSGTSKAAEFYRNMPLYQSQMNMGWLAKQLSVALEAGWLGWLGYSGPILTVRGIPWR